MKQNGSLNSTRCNFLLHILLSLVFDSNFVNIAYLVNARNSGCGKVMFSQACVIHSVHRGMGVGFPVCFTGHMTNRGWFPSMRHRSHGRGGLGKRAVHILLECFLVLYKINLIRLKDVWKECRLRWLVNDLCTFLLKQVSWVGSSYLAQNPF